MKIEGSVALVTGANRGIGRAFVDDLLKRGAKKVYVAARNPESLVHLVQHGDSRLVPLTLDVTDDAQIVAAARAASDVSLLINNAGVATGGSALLTLDLAGARQEMEVNYFSLLSMARAFAPVLKANGGGGIINLLSMLSLVTLPYQATYSASKAAALAVTRSLRAELAAQQTAVVAVMPVQVETDMGQLLPPPRMMPSEVAVEALNAVEDGADEVFPGEQTRAVAKAFSADPKAVQAQLSTHLPVIA